MDDESWRSWETSGDEAAGGEIAGDLGEDLVEVGGGVGGRDTAGGAAGSGVVGVKVLRRGGELLDGLARGDAGGVCRAA